MEESSVPKFRALILEDHDFQRQMAAQILKNCGADQILEASDGEKALSQLDQNAEIDLLLCDLNMPGMDGLAFLRNIAERGNQSSVILASAMDASIIRAAEIMAKSYGLRILGVVEKPLSRNKLMPLILRHFSQKLIPPKNPVERMSVGDIAQGIERKEFIPFYQPKVTMRTCALSGVEALLRWRHPKLGLIPPAAFIPVMEENGMLTQVTFDLLEVALTQCRQWQDMGLEVPVAINVSVESLSDTALPDRIDTLLANAGLRPQLLTLEVTETVAMTDLGHALETLARCRMKGIGLSIDDYGTGFSSMQQLARLPLGELKIDQSFVTGASKEDVLTALIETSIAMAHRLKPKTVAEGVESSDDWDIIARLGCDVAQGYFIAKPMPGEDLAPWYAEWLGSFGDTLARVGPLKG